MNIHPYSNEFSDYLKDESKTTGWAEGICFPETETEVMETVREAFRRGVSLTTQGGRTGITAGAVPAGGWMVNLSKMNRIKALRHDEQSGRFSLLIEPGMLLCELQRSLDQAAFDTKGWDEDSLRNLALFRGQGAFFFSPDPTETTASLGGMVACNASGARSFKYGSIRRHVRGLRIVIGGGRVLHLQRGGCHARNGVFSLPMRHGEAVTGTLPLTPMPKDLKCAAGYYLFPDMDMIDLFIGSEGTLGIITEIEIDLLPVPPAIWGVVAFLPDEVSALHVVQDVRTQRTAPETAPAAMEYFDGHALDLLRRRHAEGLLMDLPDMRGNWRSAVYVEYHGEEKELSEALDALCGILERHGGSDRDAWIADHPGERERVRRFRHAVPETVNALIAERKKTYPQMTKLGTDMAVPDRYLEEIMAMYRADLERSKLEYVIFGHIGNNHVHVNIIPRDPEEYVQGKKLYLQWAARVVEMGGTVSAEHGIGKLKVPFLTMMYGEAVLHEWRALKRVFDAEGLFNPCNLFGTEEDDKR